MLLWPGRIGRAERREMPARCSRICPVKILPQPAALSLAKSPQRSLTSFHSTFPSLPSGNMRWTVFSEYTVRCVTGALAPVEGDRPDRALAHAFSRRRVVRTSTCIPIRNATLRSWQKPSMRTIPWTDRAGPAFAQPPLLAGSLPKEAFAERRTRLCTAKFTSRAGFARYPFIGDTEFEE
jgi:hypothetical protein